MIHFDKSRMQEALENHSLWWQGKLDRHVTFRDFLRRSPDAVKKYSIVKEKAARMYPNDIDKYIEYKSPCIEELYAMCGLL